MKRVYEISTQRDEGFMLNVVDKTGRRHWWMVSDFVHTVTFGRFFYEEWAQNFMTWIDANDVVVARIPVTWDQVATIDPGKWDWSINAQ